MWTWGRRYKTSSAETAEQKKRENSSERARMWTGQRQLADSLEKSRTGSFLPFLTYGIPARISTRGWSHVLSLIFFSLMILATEDSTWGLGGHGGFFSC